MLLEVINLTTEFNNGGDVIKVIDDVSFDINSGEIVGLAGESGSGKTVTALSILQLISNQGGKISAGQILYNGRNTGTDLIKLNNDEMTRIRGSEISMIFQEPLTSLNPVLKCGLQVTEAIRLHQLVSQKEAYAKTIELFQKVEFHNPEIIYNAYPFQLSGGERQRVMIAMAMSCQPKLLIADEPTASLDSPIQKSLLKLLEQLQSETGLSILYISHNLNVIAELASRVLVMYKGKIVEQGKVRDIFIEPQHLYTKELLSYRSTCQREKKQQTSHNLMRDKDDGIEQSLTQLENYSPINGAPVSVPILKVENLKKYFPIRNGIFRKKAGFIKAVDDVSFEIFKGETLGLVGESGSGKTTIGRSVLRLIESTSGAIFFKGIDLTELDKFDIREIRKDMQIIFQDPYAAMNPKITVGEAIAEPMRMHGLYRSEKDRNERVLYLLQKVNMKAEHYNRLPHEFSGGQRQRLVIARALALNPSLLVCDECVSALDVAVQAQLLSLLCDLQREFKLTYIFISHDLSLVKYMSDNIIVMNRGKIEEQGKPDELFNNPQSEYTKRLINTIPKEIWNFE